MLAKAISSLGLPDTGNYLIHFFCVSFLWNGWDQSCSEKLPELREHTILKPGSSLHCVVCLHGNECPILARAVPLGSSDSVHRNPRKELN